MIELNGWLLTLIIIGVLNIGVSMAKHGEKKEGKHSFTGSLLGFGIQLTLIYMAIKTGL